MAEKPPNKRRCNFMIGAAEREVLDALAYEMRLGDGEIIRRAIMEYGENHLVRCRIPKDLRDKMPRP